MYLTKYGSFWGLLPVTAGNVYWVAPAASYTVEGRTYIASDDQDGLSPERALLTLDKAVGKCTANAGDVIVLLPGAHSWAASVAADVAGITITGMPRGSVHHSTRMPISGIRCVSSITLSAADEIINVTAADIEICHLHIIPPLTGQGIDVSADGDRLHIHDCTFEMAVGADDTALMGVEINGAADDVMIDHCFFKAQNNVGPVVRISAAAIDTIIESCTVKWEVSNTAWDDVIEITTTANGQVIRDCDFLQSTTTDIGDVLDVAGATTDEATTVLRCVFPVGADALETGNNADVSLGSNITMQIGGVVGGTVVAA